MLLNYDFLELVDEPQRNTSLTGMIDKALADKKLARQNAPRVRIKGGLSLQETLDAFGDELSRLKNSQKTTIKATNLNSILNKIKSGLPFGTISAVRVFKPIFDKHFNEKQRLALTQAYESGLDIKKSKDNIIKLWVKDTTKPIKVKDFFNPPSEYRKLVGVIYDKLCTTLTTSYVDKFIDSNATMRDFMSSDRFVKKFRYTQKDNIKRTQELKSLLDQKRHFLGYVQVMGYWKDNINNPLFPDKEVSFFVFQNEPSNTFDLLRELLVLAPHFNQAAICYCANDTKLPDYKIELPKMDIKLEEGDHKKFPKSLTRDKYKVQLICTKLGKEFGDLWDTFDSITLSTPNELPHSLTRLQDKVYTFFKKHPEKDNYGISFKEIVKTQIKAIRLPKDFTEGLGVMDFVKSSIIARQKSSRTNGYQKSFSIDEIESWEQKAIFDREKLKCMTSKSFRQSYSHNVKVYKLANAMLKGKKVSPTLIAKVLANTIDTDAGYCFISPTDLATQLDNISPRLSKSIVTAIEQAEGIRLTYALIDKVSYNSLHNILNFIFDIDNPLSDQDFEELVIEVPREALKNVKLPQIKNVLTGKIHEGAYQFKS